MLLPVEVVVERRHRHLALVAHPDLRRLAERHREERVERLLRAHRQRLRLPHEVLAEPEPEEVADRRLDAGVLLAVPEDAQHQLLEVVALGRGDGEPHVGDHARSLELGERARLSRRERRACAGRRRWCRWSRSCRRDGWYRSEARQIAQRRRRLGDRRQARGDRREHQSRGVSQNLPHDFPPSKLVSAPRGAGKLLPYFDSTHALSKRASDSQSAQPPGCVPEVTVRSGWPAS